MIPFDPGAKPWPPSQYCGPVFDQLQTERQRMAAKPAFMARRGRQ
jgi:hypothetical protein